MLQYQTLWKSFINRCHRFVEALFRLFSFLYLFICCCFCLLSLICSSSAPPWHHTCIYITTPSFRHIHSNIAYASFSWVNRSLLFDFCIDGNECCFTNVNADHIHDTTDCSPHQSMGRVNVLRIFIYKAPRSPLASRFNIFENRDDTNIILLKKRSPRSFFVFLL